MSTLLQYGYLVCPPLRPSEAVREVIAFGVPYFLMEKVLCRMIRMKEPMVMVTSFSTCSQDSDKQRRADVSTQPTATRRRDRGHIVDQAISPVEPSPGGYRLSTIASCGFQYGSQLPSAGRKFDTIWAWHTAQISEEV